MSYCIDIISRIKEQFVEMTNAEKRVAQFILDDIESINRLPIARLAQEISVSAATITRFAKSLNCEDVRDLKMKPVQSLSEPNLAIIGFGKRDAAFDEGLPQPIAHYRHGQSMPFIANKMTTEKIMDQHAMLHYSDEVQLKVGDILIFGTSHPCITFDKWRQLYFVDEQYNVLESVTTYF